MKLEGIRLFATTSFTVRSTLAFHFLLFFFSLLLFFFHITSYVVICAAALLLHMLVDLFQRFLADVHLLASLRAARDELRSTTCFTYLTQTFPRFIALNCHPLDRNSGRATRCV